MDWFQARKLSASFCDFSAYEVKCFENSKKFVVFFLTTFICFNRSTLKAQAPKFTLFLLKVSSIALRPSKTMAYKSLRSLNSYLLIVINLRFKLLFALISQIQLIIYHSIWLFYKRQYNIISLLFISMSVIRDAFILSGIVVLVLWGAGAFHIIDSGHIGVYKRGGALLNSWTEPGIHFMIPFLTKYHQVQVTLQTDQVRNIPCGTSSGVVLEFDKIEVVNRLRKDLAHQTIKNYTVTYDQTWIFSKIHHEINQFCSSHSLQDVLIEKFNILDESLKDALQRGCNQWAPGIQIIAVRVTKPNVPRQIAKTYEQREVERTKLLIRKEEQKLRSKQSQIEKRIQKIKAETSSKISEIENKINLAEKQANYKINAIQNDIVVMMESAKAKSMKYRQQKTIELNKKKIIPEKQLAVLLTNIKNAQKNIYADSIGEYLQESIKIVSKMKAQKGAGQKKN